MTIKNISKQVASIAANNYVKDFEYLIEDRFSRHDLSNSEEFYVENPKLFLISEINDNTYEEIICEYIDAASNGELNYCDIYNYFSDSEDDEADQESIDKFYNQINKVTEIICQKSKDLVITAINKYYKKAID